MNRADRSRQLCTELRSLWLEATGPEREIISAEISALTQRGAFTCLSERVMAEMRGND